MDDIDEGLAVYDIDQHRSLAFTFGGHDARACGLSFKTAALWALGYPRQAVECGRQALEFGRELEHPHSQANSHAWVSLAFRLLGDLELARAVAEAGLVVSTDYGFPQWGALCTIIRGSIVVASGHVDAGLDEMRRGLAGWQATGAGILIPVFLGFIAEAEIARGDSATALGLVEDALRRIEVYGERLYEAELYRLRGAALLVRPAPDPARAESCFLRALDIARRQRTKSWELRTTASLARLWRERGRGPDARGLLAEAAQWFSDGPETNDLRDARHLLDELA